VLCSLATINFLKTTHDKKVSAKNLPPILRQNYQRIFLRYLSKVMNTHLVIKISLIIKVTRNTQPFAGTENAQCVGERLIKRELTLYGLGASFLVRRITINASIAPP
jgi:hypothetical protein